jgi:multiple sugar transport system permease protein
LNHAGNPKWYAGRPLGIDSYFVLIVPALFSAYGTFMLRQFFLGIPVDLEDAARIDGCGLFQIYRFIIIPLSGPALATLATFTFFNNWRSFMWPLIMTNNEQMQTLQVGLATMQGQYSTEWEMLMAGAMMAVGPLVVVFLCAQRFFVSGIQLGGVKE